MKDRETIKLTVFAERRHVDRFLEISEKPYDETTREEQKEYERIKLYLAACVRGAYVGERRAP